MWCPECNKSGGCDCHEPPKEKYRPRDHKKELEQWLAGIDAEIRAEKDNHFRY